MLKQRFGVLVVVGMVVVGSAAACGSSGGSDGGSSRPSVDAIRTSMAGSNLVSDLSAKEVACFAKEVHDGSMSDELLTKLVSNDSSLTSADKDSMDSAFSAAADKCGFEYAT